MIYSNSPLHHSLQQWPQEKVSFALQCKNKGRHNLLLISYKAEKAILWVTAFLEGEHYTTISLRTEIINLFIVSVDLLEAFLTLSLQRWYRFTRWKT